MEKANLLTVEELSEFLNLSKPAVYALVYRRQVPFLKIGNRLRFSPAAIAVWLEESQVPAKNG